MEITEVRIRLVDDPNGHLKAFCSVTFDDVFVVRDLKIIGGSKGVFVAMPSRKLTDRCPRCSEKNNLRARYCTQCGTRLDDKRGGRDDAGRTKLHADIAHPISSQFRDLLQEKVLDAYRKEEADAGASNYAARSASADDALEYESEIDATLERIARLDETEEEATTEAHVPETEPTERAVNVDVPSLLIDEAEEEDQTSTAEPIPAADAPVVEIADKEEDLPETPFPQDESPEQKEDDEEEDYTFGAGVF